MTHRLWDSISPITFANGAKSPLLFIYKILFLNEVLTRIHEFSPTPGRPFVLGLPTGSTPLPTYKALIAMVNEKTLSYVTHVMVMKTLSPWELRSFKNVVTFNMDEYVGLPQDHQESFHTFMFREFFSQSEAVWRLTPPLKLTFICSWYPSIPSEYPRWQRRRSNRGVCLIWTTNQRLRWNWALPGRNRRRRAYCLQCNSLNISHCTYWCSPWITGARCAVTFGNSYFSNLLFGVGSSLASRTRIKTLAYDTILANARFFNNDISAVPRMALTVGVATVLDAREVVVIVTGQRKALALSKAIGRFFATVALQPCSHFHRGRGKPSGELLFHTLGPDVIHPFK